MAASARARRRSCCAGFSKPGGDEVFRAQALHYDPPASSVHRIEEELVKTIAALAVMLLASAAAHAQEQQQQSFKTIIGKGYDIKSVTFAKGESTDNRETFVVTLQKEKSVAVCYFAAANWISLSSSVLEDSKRCDVR
jgi:hypothetical protein